MKLIYHPKKIRRRTDEHIKGEGWFNCKPDFRRLLVALSLEIRYNQ